MSTSYLLKKLLELVIRCLKKNTPKGPYPDYILYWHYVRNMCLHRVWAYENPLVRFTVNLLYYIPNSLVCYFQCRVASILYGCVVG